MTSNVASIPNNSIVEHLDDSKLPSNSTIPRTRSNDEAHSRDSWLGQLWWGVSLTSLFVARDFRLLTARHIALTGKTRRGLEADQKVIAAHGCYAMTATTALTAQNTQGVFGIHETPTAFVQQQIEAVVEDVGVDVVKTGIAS